MKILYTISLVLFFSLSLAAQNFLNGSFENNTAPLACSYNLNNATFNSIMSDVNAYGAGNETDIMISGCFVPSIPDGDYCIALAAPNSDEAALALSASLVAGNTYSFTFYTFSHIDFRIQGDVQVGASTNNSSFGSLIYTANTVPNTWVQHTVNFTAPNNSTHITVRNIAGNIHWNRVDDFEFVTLLPINIQEFTAQRAQENVSLRWQTEQELNNDYFILQHSTDAVNWVNIEQIQGKGTTEELSSYQYLHEDPMAGVNYYRLAQVDFDGNKTWSEVRAIDFEGGLQQDIALYPNPSTGIVNIRMTADQQIAEVKVINALGQLVEIQHNGMTTYDWNHLDAGMYFIEITTQEGISSRHQLILK